MSRLFAAVLFVFAAASHAAAIVVPAGTIISIRLTTPVSSQEPAGRRAEAVVCVPVNVDAVTAVAPGTKLTGKTAEVRAAAENNQPATLRLVFDKIDAGGNKTQPLEAELSAVDNVRESVGGNGLITGIVSSETWYGRMNSGIDKVANSHPGLAQILGNVRDSFVKQVDASIAYPAGTDMQLKLTKDLTRDAAGNPPVAPAIEPLQEITAIAQAEPSRTAAASDPPKPSDLTNLMFIGSSEELEAAFKAAGWSPAAARDNSSTMETARAIIENRGYKEAPVSLLTLAGQAPDFVFQKQTNTFAMRHHIRIFKRPEQFQGKSIFVASATHDTGIDFSPENHTFIHKIDSNIDDERAKVVNDLAFAGYVQAFALIPRQVPSDMSNATGDVIKTDGKMAACLLGARGGKPAAVSIR